MPATLYSLVDKNNLHNMTEAFYGCIQLPIQIIDENGVLLETFGDTPHFCSIFQKFLTPEDSCEKVHLDAGKRAVELGETYIFSCHAHLNHIVFPIISKDKYLGSILLGPFLMEEVDSTLISDIAVKYKVGIDSTLDLFEYTNEIPIVSPSLVNHINRLLFFLFQNLIGDSKERLKIKNQVLIQQSRINEAIQRYKSVETNQGTYPYEMERSLITKVKSGNLSDARAILNDLLGYVFFSKGNNLDSVKPRSIELCALLSRAAIEGGAPSNTILQLNDTFLESLQHINTMDMLCIKLQEVVETFTESMFSCCSSKNTEPIKKAFAYISANFSTPITLDEVAEHVHLHPAYFSNLFKQSSGITFKEYLNKTRIEESKRLLSNTDYSIIDIAIACGFEDQSYFSKVFKKHTGMTPKQFR